MMNTQSETFVSDEKMFPPARERNDLLNHPVLMLATVFQTIQRGLHVYSLASSTFPLGSHRGLFSIMVYGKGGTSQLVKSSFLGTLQVFKSSFLSRARLLMLPGGLPGLTLYPAALVVPRGLPGLVLNPAALVVPSGRPVLVRYPADFVVPDGLPRRPDLDMPFFFLDPSGPGASVRLILSV